MFEVEIFHFLILSSIVFVISIFGILINRRNLILILMSIELMLLAVNLNMVAFSKFTGNITGQVFTIFILTVAAAEAAIGLAILVVYYRNCQNTEIQEMNRLKG